MLPSKFPEQNKVFVGPKGSDILPLPVHQNYESITSCWQMSWRERWAALWTGKIWVNVIGNAQPAIGLVAGNYFIRKPWLIACRHCYGNGYKPGSCRQAGVAIETTTCVHCDGTGLNWIARLMRKLERKLERKAKA